MSIDLKKLFSSNDITNSKMQNALLQAIVKESDESFDYLKFKASVSTMENMGMDKSTAIHSAFATASVMGVTKKSLINSVKKYMRTMDGEKQEFAKALKNKIAKNVDGKRVEAERLAKEIESHKAKIEKLQKEIALFEEKISKVDEVVATAQEKINKTRDDFRTTFDAIYTQLEEDMINIDTTLT